MLYSRFKRTVSTAVILSAAALAGVAGLKPARGDIFVANNTSGTVGEYTNSGATVNASIVSGLGYATGLAASGSYLFIGSLTNITNAAIDQYKLGSASTSTFLGGLRGDLALGISGSDLFFTNTAAGTVGESSILSGTTNTSFISGLSSPYGLAVSGSDIYVSNMYNGVDVISEYTTSGTLVNADLITINNNVPFGLAVSGADIFVANGQDNSTAGSGSISEYTTSGQLVNASLVSGLNEPYGLAVYGSDIFVANHGSGTIGEYTTSGETVNASLVTGLSGPFGIVVTPEPASLAIMVAASAGALLLRRRIRA